MMDYRKDIDGLRAVAVVPVILFHADMGLFNGGFLGVDIFFVISGFLITSILISELQENKFSLVRFYERRARRILPALFIVSVITFIAATILFPPYELKELSQSLLSVVLFISNMFFYLEIDYFSSAAEEMPMIHTWSLAIEEQFYLFFPILLFFIWKYKSNKAMHVFVVLSVASFASALYLTKVDSAASFYWIIPRAWELLAGSICALLIERTRNFNNRYISDLSLLALVCLLIFWPAEASHPGYLTLLPVLAVCLIILYPHKSSFAYKILTSAGLVYIGLISYSLYLWHQPVLALLRFKSEQHPSTMAFLFTIVLVAALSMLSYRYVETPFRNKKKYSQSTIFRYSFCCLAVMGLIGISGHLTAGFPKRYLFLDSYTDSMQFSPKRLECHSSSSNYIKPEDSCTYFGSNVTWATFGDSHTVEPAYALARVLEKHDIGIRHHSFSGCPPALNYVIKGNKKCSKWLNETLENLEKDESIKNVLVGFRYSHAIFGDHKATYPQAPNKVKMKLLNSDIEEDTQKLELYWDSLHEIVERLLAANKQVFLMEPIPELPMHISKGVSGFTIFNSKPMLDLNSASSAQFFQDRHKFILTQFSTLEANVNLHIVSPFDLLCSEVGCPAVLSGKALYFDDDHLSTSGAIIMFDRFTESYPQAIAP